MSYSPEILRQSPYAELWAKLNHVKVHVKDKYRGRNRFPIGTFKPIQTYPQDEDVPKEEIYFFEPDTVACDNASSNLYLGTSGTFKTTLIKTMVYYNSFIPHTKIGILSLKENSLDWVKCNLPHNNPGMLYPHEPATLHIQGGCPEFALRNMPEQDKKRVIRMNLPLKEFADLNLLTGLGFSPAAKQHMYRWLLDGVSPDKLLAKIESTYKMRKLPKQTYDNLTLINDNLIRSGFLTDSDVFDMNKIWDNDYSWVLGFNNKEIPYLSVYVDRILNMVYDRANSSKGEKERYYIVVDDAYKAFGLDPMKYPSVQTGTDSLVLWRSMGINMNITAQSPTMLNEEIYNDIKHFFIYRCSNVGMLSKYIPNHQIIEDIRKLVYRPQNYISQCMHVHPDRSTYTMFYPFNSPIANAVMIPFLFSCIKILLRSVIGV